jgi:hypothetical protein
LKLAIMQPYFLPYLGYFQLMHEADRFVVYDDVGWIKGGWIHRNRIRVGDEGRWFTLPTRGASPNRSIHEVELGDLGPWRRKFTTQLAHAYAKAPQRDATLALVERICAHETDRVAELARHALTEVAGVLGIDVAWVPTSRRYQNADLAGQERVLDICAREGATRYVNPIGGVSLYDPGAFAARGIELRFLECHAPAYAQGKEPFVPHLSILDVLFWNTPEQITPMLDAYALRG